MYNRLVTKYGYIRMYSVTTLFDTEHKVLSWKTLVFWHSPIYMHTIIIQATSCKIKSGFSHIVRRIAVIGDLQSRPTSRLEQPNERPTSAQPNRQNCIDKKYDWQKQEVYQSICTLWTLTLKLVTPLPCAVV